MKKKRIAIIIISFLLVAFSLFAYFLYTEKIEIFNKEETIVEEEIVEIDNEKLAKKQLWNENKNINSDYIGEIYFESDLINKSFVQAKDVYDSNGNMYHFYNEDGTLVNDVTNYNGNDVYIWTNWKDMSYDYNILGGSVFMDYRNEINDQNIIIYGHHFSESGGNDPERIKAFTPLEKLFEEENYKQNSRINILLENEIREYELFAVYKFDVDDDFCNENLQYYRTEYNYDEFNDIVDSNYYQNYIDSVNKVKLYDTDISLDTTDKTLTLQTCISGYAGSIYEICVFKQTNIEYLQ